MCYNFDIICYTMFIPKYNKIITCYKFVIICYKLPQYNTIQIRTSAHPSRRLTSPVDHDITSFECGKQVGRLQSSVSTPPVGLECSREGVGTLGVGTPTLLGLGCGNPTVARARVWEHWVWEPQIARARVWEPHSCAG